jgi:hypothetical protein
MLALRPMTISAPAFDCYWVVVIEGVSLALR